MVTCILHRLLYQTQVLVISIGNQLVSVHLFIPIFTFDIMLILCGEFLLNKTMEKEVYLIFQ